MYTSYVKNYFNIPQRRFDPSSGEGLGEVSGGVVGVLGHFPAGLFPASLFSANFSPLGLFSAGLFPTRSFPR